jgi:dTDP-4-dehydrorhamnose reductase
MSFFHRWNLFKGDDLNRKKRAIIIGASSSIGISLYARRAETGRPVVGTSYRKKEPQWFHLDLTSQSISDIVPDLGFLDTVYLLASMTNPNQVCKQPELAAKVNINGVQRQIDATLKKNAHFVFFSSSQVFDGRGGGYAEDDQPNPLTVYGQQKYHVEKYLQNKPGRWCIIRTDTIVTPKVSTNCPVEKTYVSLWKGNGRMAADNLLSLTTLEDFLSFLDWVEANCATGLFHFAGPPVPRSDLATWIQADSIYGGHMAFTPVAFDELNFPEPRPKKTWLDSRKAADLTGIRPKSAREAVHIKVTEIDRHIDKKGKFRNVFL